MKKYSVLWLLSCLTFTGFLGAQTCEPEYELAPCCEAEPACIPKGKADIGAAYVHIDILFSGHTVHKMDVAAIKGDLNYRVWSGLVVKPTFLFGGGRNDNEVATGGFGVGFTIPLSEVVSINPVLGGFGCKIPCVNFSITPLVGCNWGYLRSTFKYPHPMTDALGIAPRVRERFRSQSPYVGFEASWTFRPTWRVVFCYQYAWSRTHTQLRLAGIDPADLPIGLKKEDTNSRSRTQGSNISGMIEHDLNDSWSVNLGAAYNNSLSKEKHGLRGWGVKLGVAYWF